MAPCGTRAMRENLAWRTSSVVAARRSSSPRRTLPLTILPGGRIIRIKASTVVDFPDPDSPTSPSRIPAPSAKETPLTARAGPFGVAK